MGGFGGVAHYCVEEDNRYSIISDPLPKHNTIERWLLFVADKGYGGYDVGGAKETAHEQNLLFVECQRAPFACFAVDFTHGPHVRDPNRHQRKKCKAYKCSDEAEEEHTIQIIKKVTSMHVEAGGEDDGWEAEVEEEVLIKLYILHNFCVEVLQI